MYVGSPLIDILYNNSQTIRIVSASSPPIHDVTAICGGPITTQQFIIRYLIVCDRD